MRSNDSWREYNDGRIGERSMEMRVGDGSVFVRNVWIVRRAVDAVNVGKDEVACDGEDSRKGLCIEGKNSLRTRSS